MNQRSVRCLAAAAWLVCAALGCAKLTESPNVGTNTNWLQVCSASDDCGDGRSCLCGVCTQACSSSSQCAEVHESTRCEPLSETACGAASPATSSACLQGCRSNSDCTALDHGVCRDGLCVPAPGAVAGASDAGMSVSFGQDADTPAPGFELSRDENGTVAITAAYTACETHADCMLVTTGCNGCCQQGAVARALEQTYRSNYDQACSGYQGPICDCQPPDLVARCEAGSCRAVERSTLECFSPTQNADRLREPGLVGCTCTPDTSICIKSEGNYMALFCDREEGANFNTWFAAFDGPCWAVTDDACSRGEVRPTADACLAEFSSCYVLTNGEFCGTP